MNIMAAMVLGGTLLWGARDVLQSYFLRQRKVHEDVVAIAISTGIALCALVSQLIFYGVPKAMPNFWLAFSITAVLNVFILYGNIKALKFEDASIIAPLSATMPLLVVIISWFILAEWPTTMGYIGIFLLALGSYVLQLRGSAVELPQLVAHILPS